MSSVEQSQAIHLDGLVTPAVFSAVMRRVALVMGVLAVVSIGRALSLPEPNAPPGDWYVPAYVMFEIFSIVVSTLTFVVGWHYLDSRPPLSSTILSTSFLAIALLGVGHVLSFTDISMFESGGFSSGEVLFRRAASTVGAVALIAVAVTPYRDHSPRLRRAMLSLLLAMVVLVYWVAHAGGNGGAVVASFTTLTSAGRGTVEYVLAIAYVLAAALLLRTAFQRQDTKLVYLAAAAGVMSMSELAFAGHAESHDLVPLVGASYKFVAACLLCRALYDAGVREPYALLQLARHGLSDSERRFRCLFDVVTDACFVVDPRGRIVEANQAAKDRFAADGATLAGVPAEALIPDWKSGPARREAVINPVEARSFPAEIRVDGFELGDGRHTIIAVRDLSESRSLERKLFEQSSLDMLTGLPNRQLILERLEEAIKWTAGSGSRLAVMFMDLDAFKRVNDAYGHAAGDQVLRECVARLQPLMPPGTVLARLGSDEFIIVHWRVRSDDMLAELANRFLSAVRAPFEVGGKEVFLTASIGIALYPDDAGGAEALLHRAHLAMDSVKRCKRDAYRRYSSVMGSRLRETLELEAALHHAAERGELRLYYQPKVSIETGTVVGVEALVRWMHPRLGIVPPSRFIPIAEESGFIVRLGEWILAEACRQARMWQRDGMDSLRISVNISARQLLHGLVVRQVSDVLRTTGLEGSRLDLEITETAVMRNPEAAADTLRALKAMGVSISLDDFGTGYASLGYLKRFPIDEVKIDRSFVSEIATNSNDADIVAGVTGLVHRLGLKVVAEGVERQEQLTVLRSLECDVVQGYFFSEPVPAEELPRVIAHISERARRMAGCDLRLRAPADIAGMASPASGIL